MSKAYLWVAIKPLHINFMLKRYGALVPTMANELHNHIVIYKLMLVKLFEMNRFMTLEKNLFGGSFLDINLYFLCLKVRNLCLQCWCVQCELSSLNMAVQFVLGGSQLKSTGRGRALIFCETPHFIVIAHCTLPFVANHPPTWNRCFHWNPSLKLVSWRGPMDFWCALNDSCFSRQSYFCTSFIQIIKLAAKSVRSSSNLVLKTSV